MLMKWAREEIFRFRSGFERGFFLSFSATEKMPVLDFVKIKNPNRTESLMATLFQIQQPETGT